MSPCTSSQAYLRVRIFDWNKMKIQKPISDRVLFWLSKSKGSLNFLLKNAISGFEESTFFFDKESSLNRKFKAKLISSFIQDTNELHPSHSSCTTATPLIRTHKIQNDLQDVRPLWLLKDIRAPAMVWTIVGLKSLILNRCHKV